MRILRFQCYRVKQRRRHALSGFLTFKAWLNEPLACSLRANLSFHCCPMKTRKGSINKHINVDMSATLLLQCLLHCNHLSLWKARAGLKRPNKSPMTTWLTACVVNITLNAQDEGILLNTHAVKRLTGKKICVPTLTNPALLGRVLARAAATLTDNILSGC